MQTRVIVIVKVNEFQCSSGFLSHSVDVICKSCDILSSRQGCIMLKVLWCCWISGGFWKIYCVNICRTPLAYSSVSYIHREGRRNFGDESFRMSEACMANYDYAPDQGLRYCFRRQGYFAVFISLSRASLKSSNTFVTKNLE
jgi:hypothetical protein